MNTLVSVIMPVYNGEKFVEEAIESVFNQTYKNIELIVIDDGSTDTSKQKIQKKFEENQSSVKTFYYYQANQGPSVARNRGVQQASGRYISLLDADDLYHPDKLTKQVEYLNRHRDVDITYNDVQVVDEHLHHLNILRSEEPSSHKETFLTNFLFRQIIPAPACIMLKKECFTKVKYNSELIYAEDYDFLIRLAEQFNFGYEPGAYYICRRHNENLTNNHKKQVESEKEIIRCLGEEKIKHIVFSSIYHDEIKQLMFGKIMYKIGNFKTAESTFLSMVANVMNPYVFFYLGNLLYIKQQYREAVSYYQKALTFNGELAEVYNNMGCCYQAQGVVTRAKDCFKNALKLRPNYQDALYNLEALQKQTGDYKFTQRELRKQLLDYQM